MSHSSENIQYRSIPIKGSSAQTFDKPTLESFQTSDPFHITFQFSHISDVGLDENNAVRAVLGLKLPDSILPLPNIHIANSHILQRQVTGRIPETCFVSEPSVSVYSSMEWNFKFSDYVHKWSAGIIIFSDMYVRGY